jgi:hypothetical protein
MNDFTVEMLALLKKYNVTINWGCHPCSDLHGVHDQYMEVVDNQGIIVMYLDGNCISPYEINDQVGYNTGFND